MKHEEKRVIGTVFKQSTIPLGGDKYTWTVEPENPLKGKKITVPHLHSAISPERTKTNHTPTVQNVYLCVRKSTRLLMTS